MIVVSDTSPLNYLILVAPRRFFHSYSERCLRRRRFSWKCSMQGTGEGPTMGDYSPTLA